MFEIIRGCGDAQCAPHESQPEEFPAVAFWNAGCSVIPIRLDGSKSPAISKWKQYQQRQPSLDELDAWFPNKSQIGFGVVCGAGGFCRVGGVARAGGADVRFQGGA